MEYKKRKIGKGWRLYKYEKRNEKIEKCKTVKVEKQKCRKKKIENQTNSEIENGKQ